MSSPSPASPAAPSLQELRASRGKPPSGARRFLKWIIAGGVVVFLVLFGFFGLPPIVKAQAIKQLSARLGRPVTIEKIRVNPLVLSATIEGLSIAEAGASASEFTGWRRLYANFDSWSLFTGQIRFQKIELDGFRARVAKNQEGGFNFADIVATLSARNPSEPPPPPKDPAAKTKPFSVGKLSVTDARVLFDDASRDRPFATEIGPLTFSLDDFRTVGDPNSPYQFEAVTTAGERFAWKGVISADPAKSQGELILANIDLARLSPYYHSLLKGELRSAFADLSARYNFEMKETGPVFTLADAALTLRDVRFGALGVEADAFALKRLAISGVNADSVARQAVIAKVLVEGVRLKVVRNADGIDLLHLLQPAKASSAQAGSPSAGAATSSEAGSPPPRVMVAEFSLSGLQAEVVDLTTPRRAEHRIEDLSLTLRDIDSADLAKALPVALEAKLPNEGKISLSGTVAARPLAATVEVALDNVPFANASPYVEPFLNIRLAGGVIRTRGKATLHDGVGSFAGDIGIAAFSTVDGKLTQDFVRWEDLSLTGILLGTSPLAFHADLIRLVRPTALLRTEPDGSTNVSSVGPPEPEEKKPAAPVATVRLPEDHPATKPIVGTLTGPVIPQNPFPFEVTVDRVEIEQGAFRYEDHSIKPTARATLNDFSGSVTGLSSESLGRADVDLRGKVDGVAPVSITGKLNPLGTPAFVDLAIDFKGIDLQPGVGPYVAKFAGRGLARGNLSLAIEAKLEERRVNVANVVTLDQFYLGAKNNSPDATTLPVGLALSLLRDTQGKIVVDLPVKGSLDDPNFQVGRVVLRVVVNIIAKAATSPFSLLGAAFGGGGEELGWQDFAVGETALDPTDIKKLETLATALNARPALSLDIAGAYDPTYDLAALRFARLDDQVRARAWEERRKVDPNTPAPEKIDITPQLHTGMITKLHAEAFPNAAGQSAAATAPAEGLPPPAVPREAVAARAPDAAPQSSRLTVGRLPRFYVRGAYSEGGKAVPPRREPAAPPPVSAPEPEPAKSAAEPAAPGMSVDDMEARLAERIEIPPADLQAVGDARAQAVRAWLVETGKVAPERMFLAPVTAAGTRVNLTLK